jgi:hypothetical protein
MAMRIVSGGAVALIAAVLAACGLAAATPAASATPGPSVRPTPSQPPGSVTPTSGPPSGACLLLSSAQIDLVLGVTVAAGTPSGPAGCIFTYTGPVNGLTGVPFLQGTLTVAIRTPARGCQVTASRPLDRALASTPLGIIGG